MVSLELENQVRVLHDAVCAALKEVANLDPGSREYMFLKKRVHRSSQLLDTIVGVYDELTEKMGIEEDDEPPPPTQGDDDDNRSQGRCHLLLLVVRLLTQFQSFLGLPPRVSPHVLVVAPFDLVIGDNARKRPIDDEDDDREVDTNKRQRSESVAPPIEFLQQSDSEEEDTPRQRKQAVNKDPSERTLVLMAQHPECVLLKFKILLDVVLNFREGRAAEKVTDGACSRLFSLYAVPDEARIVTLLNRNGVPETKWSAVLKKCKAADKLAIHHDAGGRLILWVTRIVNTILELKSAIEYNQLRKKEKTEYVSDAFERENATELELLRAHTDHPAKVKSLKTKYVREYGKKVLARNATFKLYQIFGANVIAEPLFQLVPKGSMPLNGKNLRQLTSHLITHRQSILVDHGLLDAFREKFEDIPNSDATATQGYFSASHDSTSQLIVSSVKHIAGEELGAYVQAFLDKREQMMGVVIDG
ncbi:hypothetical protein NMY22_g11306 [Coprinellus aureogranulatus]|nr:hypothetical protein NMY22_g11306 [Coprinellus aureogranulatus]